MHSRFSTLPNTYHVAFEIVVTPAVSGIAQGRRISEYQVEPEQLGQGGQAPQVDSGASGQVPAPEPQAQVTAQPQTDTGFVSVRDHLNSQGLGDLAGRFTDDEALVGHLVQQYQQAQQLGQYQPYVQQYLAHAGEFQQFLTERQRQQALQQQQQQPKFWDPPAIQPGWEQLAAQEGAPPHIKHAVDSYRQYQRDFAQKFLSNPADTLKPLITQIAQEVSGGMLQQNLGVYQERSAAREFVQQNQTWLYARDQMGNTRLSPEGERFQEYVKEAESLGVPGVAAQQRYAMRLLNAGRAPQANPSQSQNQQLKQNFLRQPNPAGSFNLSGPGTNPQPATQPTSLNEALRRNLAAGGVTDETLATEYR